MKDVILSADAELFLYQVPNKVYYHLEEYCNEFAHDFLVNDVRRKEIIKKRGIFDQSHFIEYLNKFVFPDEPSKLIKKIGYIDEEPELQEKYSDLPSFNF